MSELPETVQELVPEGMFPEGITDKHQLSWSYVPGQHTCRVVHADILQPGCFQTKSVAWDMRDEKMTWPIILTTGRRCGIAN